MALDTAKKSEIIAKFGKSATDTGSSAVQIALLTTRIVELTEHLQKFTKDHASRLGLLKLVGQRKRLMRYLKRSDRETFNKVIAELGLRGNV
ncbi:MAG: 30S ribosomal protein S15 [Sulfuricurvum sp. PC08-66]|nr:MAG: 30S ribosomal protein S15 [Sulfuricurvum sp. PC08-66]